VAIPEGAKTPDLRSKGVELIARSPVLMYWASGNQSRRYPSADTYRGEFGRIAAWLCAKCPDEYVDGICGASGAVSA
jgi:hypothetical protein